MKALLCAVLVFVVLLGPTVSSQDVGEGIREFGKAVFSEVERRVIRDYYQSKHGSIDSEDHDDGNDDRESGSSG